PSPVQRRATVRRTRALCRETSAADWYPVCLLAQETPMVVFTSQRAQGVQRLRDFTSHLQAWAWLPMLLIRLHEGLMCVDAGRRTLFDDLAGFGTFFV